MPVQIKRIYEVSDLEDGRRVLVDRIWPRGISKDKANLSEWMKDIAPSNELCKWFNHDPQKFGQFSAMYQTELQQAPRSEYLQQLVTWAQEDQVTLVYAAKDQEHNQALVLKQLLDEVVQQK